MTVEYVVLGAILIVMGVVQTWLRHGPEGRRLRAEQQAVSERRLENVSEDQRDLAVRQAKRGGKAWNSWTAVLGGVGIAFGIVLVVLGVLGY